jgi:hypothetical protein
MLELLGTRRRAEIKVVRGPVEQQISHGTAHKGQFITFFGEQTP